MSKNNKSRFKKIKLIPRLAFIYSIIPLFIFSIIGIYIFVSQEKKIYNEAEIQMNKNLNGLIVSVKIDRNKTFEQNNISLNTFRSYISSNKSFFWFNDKRVKVDVKNNLNGIKEVAEIKNWKFRGDTILSNSKFISALSLSLKNDLIISQKTKLGYVNISSTNPDFELIFFPYSSEIVYTIENGEVYSGVSKIDGINYFVKAAPLYVNGKIEGMLLSIAKNKFSTELSEMFGNEVYFKRGYPFAMDLDGNMLIHPILKGKSINYTNLYDKILQAQEKDRESFEYIWPENSKGEKKYLIVQYLPELEIFVAISYYDSDLKIAISKLKISLLIAVFMSTLTVVLSIIFVANFFLKRMKLISENIHNLSLGVIPEHHSNVEEGELIQIMRDENILVDNFRKLNEFTEYLKNKDFSFEYSKWSNSDKIGDNLIELNKYLRQRNEEAQSKISEQDSLVWLNEGISKFIEILKYQVIEIKDLAYRIVSQIVEYVNANEGGFFIVNQEKVEEGEKYLELLAAYAMHKEKLIKRKVPFGAGLVGRVAIEKKTLFLTEIPDSYSKISTALGQGKPKSIVILPLIFNENVIGVIELASFYVFTKLELDFLEKISENISANLAMWRASRQTAQLLRASQEQTQQQKQQQQELQNHLKELEKLRLKSEQREIELNSMIKAVDTTALLVEYDVNGMILSANSRFLETLERSEVEMIGKHHRDITSMDVISSEYKEFWSDLLEGKTKRFIESFNVQDKAIWLSQNYVPIMDKENKVFKILNIAIDVTENKVLERQLRSQVREISKEARTVRKDQRKVRIERETFLNKELAYKAVFKGIQTYVGHVEFSTDGTLLFINNKFGEILNYDIKLLENKNIKDFIPDESIETFKLAIEKIISGEEYSSEINLLNSSLEKIKVEYSLLPALNIKNKVEKIIMILNKSKD